MVRFWCLVLIALFALPGCEEAEPTASQTTVSDPSTVNPSSFIGIWDTMVPTGGSSNYCNYDLAGVPHCDIDWSTPPAACSGEPAIGGMVLYSTVLGEGFLFDEPISWSGHEVTFQTSNVTLGFYPHSSLTDSIIVEMVPGCFRQYFYYPLP